MSTQSGGQVVPKGKTGVYHPKMDRRKAARPHSPLGGWAEVLTYWFLPPPSSASRARAQTQRVQPAAEPPGQVPQRVPAQRAAHAAQRHLPRLLPAASVPGLPSVARAPVPAVPVHSRLPSLPGKPFRAGEPLPALRSVEAAVSRDTSTLHSCVGGAIVKSSAATCSSHSSFLRAVGPCPP